MAKIFQIEKINESSTVVSGLEDMFEEFMIDGKIDDNEYAILIKFLENLRTALPVDIYYSIKNKIDNNYNSQNNKA